MNDDLITSVIEIVHKVVLGSIKANGRFDPVTLMRQIGAINTIFREAQKEFADNTLIAEVVRRFENYKLEEGVDLGSFETEDALSAVERLDVLLADTDRNSAEIKAFIYEIAERIAAAAGSGLFGMGKRINIEEQTYLTEIKTRMGI